MPSLLSKKQKAAVCATARKAFAGIGENELSFADWRHEQTIEVTGLASLTACTQGHYLPLMAHFYDLAGEPDKAFECLTSGKDTDRKQLLWLVNQEVGKKLTEEELKTKRQFDMKYVERLCEDKFKLPLERLDATALRHLLFTLRNRRSILSGK